MDKEFEALEDFKELKEVLANQKIKYAGIVNFNLDTIEQALAELKAIKEAKPSEALKCLENLRKSANTFCQHMPEQCELNKKYADTIKQALLKQLSGSQYTNIVLDEAVKPSEAMECLERIDKEYASIESDDFDNCFNTIKQALLKAQEVEK